MNLLATLTAFATHGERWRWLAHWRCLPPWRWLPRWGRDGVAMAAFWLAVGLLAGHLVVLPAVLLGVMDQGVVLVLLVVHATALLLGHGHEPAT